MRRIAIINQKGGVGKTTTAVNLGAALARAGQRVCLLDLDPQAHATTHLGLQPDGTAPSMYDVLIESRPLAEVRRQVEDNLWVVGSDINLAAAEVELAGVVGREVILRDLLQAREGPQVGAVDRGQGMQLVVDRHGERDARRSGIERRLDRDRDRHGVGASAGAVATCRRRQRQVGIFFAPSRLTARSPALLPISAGSRRSAA